MKKGFTLIELLLYIAIVSVVMLSITTFLMMVLNARVKNQVILEVEEQGEQIMVEILQEVRNAQAITSPAIGVSSASLTLDVVTVADDPTIYDLSGGKIRIKEGVATVVNLNNNRVVASALNFENLGKAGTSGSVRVVFTLTHINPENKKEYDYAKTFVGTATVRQ